MFCRSYALHHVHAHREVCHLSALSVSCCRDRRNSSCHCVHHIRAVLGICPIFKEDAPESMNSPISYCQSTAVVNFVASPSKRQNPRNCQESLLSWFLSSSFLLHRALQKHPAVPLPPGQQGHKLTKTICTRPSALGLDFTSLTQHKSSWGGG